MMKNKKLFLLIFALLASFLVACGGTTAEPAASMADAQDTPAEAPPTEVPPTEVPPTEVPPTEVPPTEVPPTEVPPTEVPPTEAPPTETPLPELEPGDPQRGQDIFINGGSYEFYTPETACNSCHSLDGRVGAGYRAGPSLLGVGTRAGQRMPGLAADEYLRESIMNPPAFIAPTYSNQMSKTGAKFLTEQEVEDVIAFLLILTDGVVPDVDVPPVEAVVESDFDLAMIVAGGNPKRGGVKGSTFRCTKCHANEELPGLAPPFSSTDDLPPIMARGELRISDPAYQGRATSNQEYVLESIILPEAYVVPGEWADVMPYDYHQLLTYEDISEILSWLATFE